MSPMSLALTGPTGRSMRSGSVFETVVPFGRDDPRDDVGPHQDPRVADRAGDHRHLERRHEHALLPERHAARVDLESRFGYQSSPLRYSPLG